MKWDLDGWKASPYASIHCVGLGYQIFQVAASRWDLSNSRVFTTSAIPETVSSAVNSPLGGSRRSSEFSKDGGR